jgi:hypothetical protein
MSDEEDFYGGNIADVGCVQPTLHMDRPRWGYGDQSMIDRYWQLKIRPLLNDGCNASLHMAVVSSDNRESCTVAPHPDLPLSHVLLWGEDGYYEWKPMLLPTADPVLLVGLGDRPVLASESRVPEDFDPTLPFRILQTRTFFYIGQGLSTRTIPRTHPNKPLTLSFRGLSFNVRFIESKMEEVC